MTNVEKIELEELLSNKCLNEDDEMPIPEAQTNEQAADILIKYFDDIQQALITMKNRELKK